MKKGILACVIASTVIGNPLTFRLQRYSMFQQSSITGKVSPSEAAEAAWIISAKDTLKTTILWGNFSLQTRPGTYTLMVSAKPPYKNILLGNLEVKQNKVLNIGEIILQK
ncbi:MAG: carboxypeptidase regulatory-like domain-containing protein [Bacteroidota bacterium]|nr:carboxypeptidase regulatory-like domain-containing protein [Bacteroidota bacterium]